MKLCGLKFEGESLRPLATVRSDWTDVEEPLYNKHPVFLLKLGLTLVFKMDQLEQWRDFILQYCHKGDCHFTTVSVLGGVDVWVIHPSQAGRIVLSWCHCVGHDPFVQVRFIWHYCVICGVIPRCAILILGSFICFVIEYTERVNAVITTCLWKKIGESCKPWKCVCCNNRLPKKKIKARRVCDGGCILN